MTITLSPQTETLLQEQAERLGQDATTLADTLLQRALEDAARDFEESCAAIAEGFADIEAGRTVSLEEARAQFEASGPNDASGAKRVPPPPPPPDGSGDAAHLRRPGSPSAPGVTSPRLMPALSR
jgi:predicted transcriptional regulator